MKTLAEWNRLGYRVIKGSRHVGRNLDNEPLFSEGQVYMPGPRYGGYGYYDNDQMEEDADLAQAFGLPWGD